MIYLCLYQKEQLQVSCTFHDIIDLKISSPAVFLCDFPMENVAIIVAVKVPFSFFFCLLVFVFVFVVVVVFFEAAKLKLELTQIL